METARFGFNGAERFVGALTLRVQVAILLCCCSVAVGKDLKIRSDFNSVNGPTELLRQSLMQSAEEARLLGAAERQLQIGDNSQAFQALQAVFAHEHDSFTPVFGDKPSNSTYRAAFEILRAASYQTRKDWTQTTEVAAAAALATAVEQSDSTAIAAVAKRFPFTPSGFKAMAVATITARTLGQNVLAEALLAEMDFTYGQTALSFDTANLLSELRRRMNPASAQKVRDAVFAGRVVRDEPMELAIPWPRAIWRWEESLWSNGAMATVFGGVTLPENRSLLAMSSWRPAVTAEQIILRTPAQIVCFDKLSGRIAWQLLTDTVAPAEQLPSGIGDRSLTSRTSLADLLRMDELGSVTATENSVFFVDHFRKFESEPSKTFWPRNQQRQRRRNNLIEDSLKDPSVKDARRLVCVQLSPEPHVAWTIGDAPEFEYITTRPDSTAIARHVTTTAAGESFRPPANVSNHLDNEDLLSGKIDSKFHEHRFLGQPLAHDQLLFVLSADREIAWLNCITQSSGRLLWREPVAYYTGANAGVSNQYVAQSDGPIGASLCGIDRGVVISALKNGVVIGAQLTDGKLLWATNFREAQRNPGSRLSMAYLPRSGDSSLDSFQPLISDGRMIWAAPQSGLIRCIDTQTGRINWTVEREANGAGSLEGSIDSYAAGFDGEQIVTIGKRHIRALSTVDGSQKWITEVQRQAGRAFCNGRTCMVPQLDGSLALFETEGGTRRSVSSEFAFSEDAVFAGSLYADNEVICAATPLSVTILPAPSSMRTKGVDAANPSDEEELLQARLHLLAGHTNEAIQNLEALLARRRGQPSDEDQLADICERLLADTLLNELAKGQSRKAEKGESKLARDTSLLDSLNLDLHQRLRYQLLLPEKSSLSRSPKLRDLLTVQITPDWAARVDVAAYATLRSSVAGMIVQSTNPQAMRFCDIEQAVLFPWQIGNVDEQISYAKRLIQANLTAAAELFLVAAIESAAAPDAVLLRELQAKLRSVAAQPAAPTIVQNAEFEMQEVLSFAGNSGIPTILAATNAMVQTPDWYAERLFIVGRKFHTIDMATGAVSVPHKLPGAVDADDVVLREDVPGLVPVTGTNHIGMLSLVEPSSPKLLWWQRIDKDIADPSSIETGPVGPGFMIVATRSQIQCLHPFTGARLWQQNLTASLPSPSLFRRSERIIGDRRVIAVFGEKTTSCTLFRTLDGKRLSVVPLNIPRGQRPLVSGRMVMYSNNGTLELIDLLTGKNVLEGRAPIQVMKNGPARILRNHHAALLTRDGALSLIDMANGDVKLTCKLGEEFDKARLVGLTVVERNGYLYLLTKDFGRTERTLSASSRMGDPRLDSGTLHCIDGTSGKLLWQRPSVPSVMPKLYGDPVNFLVLWSWQNGGFSELRRLGEPQGSTQRSLQVTLVDTLTGRTLVEGKHFSPAEPIRCVHDTSNSSVTIHTEKSQIVITYD